MEQTEVTPALNTFQINEFCRDGFLYLEEFEKAFKRAFVYNPLLAKACAGLMEQMTEAHDRLMDRCPVLCGQDMGFVEKCQCPWCRFDECCDPFSDQPT